MIKHYRIWRSAFVRTCSIKQVFLTILQNSKENTCTGIKEEAWHRCFPVNFAKYLRSPLTLSWRRPLSYRNQSIDLLGTSMDWFLYDNGLRHERVKKSLWTTASVSNDKNFSLIFSGKLYFEIVTCKSTSRYLLYQSQPSNHQNNIWNPFKINHTLHWCHSGVFIANFGFEQATAYRHFTILEHFLL